LQGRKGLALTWVGVVKPTMAVALDDDGGGSEDGGWLMVVVVGRKN
jgi:hypothetical protein